jgi:hypothetical protein
MTTEIATGMTPCRLDFLMVLCSRSGSSRACAEVATALRGPAFASRYDEAMANCAAEWRRRIAAVPAGVIEVAVDALLSGADTHAAELCADHEIALVEARERVAEIGHAEIRVIDGRRRAGQLDAMVDMALGAVGR